METMTQEDREKLTDDFWKAVEDTRTVMLGTAFTKKVAARPMTAQIDDATGKNIIYFFASSEEGIGAEVLAGRHDALMTFTSKGHDLFASCDGPLSLVEDEALIDRLWSVFASLYYEDSRRDPKLLLLSFDPSEADVWRSSTTGFLKSVAYKLMGKDAGEAAPEDRGKIQL